jgi:hypothetical protein
VRGDCRPLNDVEAAPVWYHGSPERLVSLRRGSTVTQDRKLAEVFSHKPTLVSVSDTGEIKHNGTQAGFLYAVAEELAPTDLVPHPRSAMEAGKEWLTARDLHLTLLAATEVANSDRLSESEISVLLTRR